MLICIDSCMHYCITVDFGNYLGPFFSFFFQEKTIYMCVCIPCPHPLKPTQKIEKADLQSNLIERGCLRIKLENKDNLLKSFGLDQQSSNQIQGMVSDMWSPNVSFFFEAVRSLHFSCIFLWLLQMQLEV